MIYASLRFDDACHVRPDGLRMSAEALTGTSWQTKTERKRKSVHFVVANQSMQCQGWLLKGWTAFRDHLMTDRDFWMPHVQFKNEEFSMCPGQCMEYQESSQTLRAMLRIVGRILAEEADTYTWHSCKTTMFDQAAHQEENQMAIGLQGHWKDPMGAMPLKHTRQRMAIPLAMISRVCKRIRTEENTAERPHDLQPEPEPKEPIPVPPPAQAKVWSFYYTANSQAYRVGAKVHSARPGDVASLCNKLIEDRQSDVRPMPT